MSSKVVAGTIITYILYFRYEFCFLSTYPFMCDFKINFNIIIL